MKKLKIRTAETKKPRSDKPPGKLTRLKTNIAESFSDLDQEKLNQLKAQNKGFLFFVLTVVFHVKRFLEKNKEDNINAISGQSAFFIILSIVPFFMFILAIIALLFGAPTEEGLANARAQIEDIPPGHEEYAALIKLLRTVLIEGFRQLSDTTIIISVVAALWSSGKGMYILTDGISRIYRLPQKHVWIFRRVFAMGYTTVMLLLLAVYIFLLFLLLKFEEFIEQKLTDVSFLVEVLYTFRYVIATILLAVMMTLALKLYLWRKVDDKRYIKMRVLLPGMLFTSVAWNLLGWGVTIYTTYFSSSLYGSLGSVFVVLMWVYFMMLLLLYGVQINYIYRDAFYCMRIGTALKKLKNRIFKKKKTASP